MSTLTTKTAQEIHILSLLFPFGIFHDGFNVASPRRGTMQRVDLSREDFLALVDVHGRDASVGVRVNGAPLVKNVSLATVRHQR